MDLSAIEASFLEKNRAKTDRSESGGRKRRP